MICANCRTEHEDDVDCPTCAPEQASFGGETAGGPQTGGVQPRYLETDTPALAELDLRTVVIRSPEPSDGPPPPESEVQTAVAGSRHSSSAAGKRSAAGVSDWNSLSGSDGTDGTAALTPGGVLGGRYEILEMLGEGGMGSVYKARDLEVNRIVAIKIIRAELADDPLIVQRFKQELVLAREVTHRNVVRIYDLGTAGSVRFISMEFIEGRELNEHLKERGKFQAAEAAGIILQVSLGLGAAHDRGVIHRDLKPQNIMLDGEGRAAVMDFGIARSAELASSESAASFNTTIDTPSQLTQLTGLTMVGSLLGTPRYMSPEQAHGTAVDVRSDIYSLGIIFYELLTGKLPFTAPTVKELLRRRGLERVPAVIEAEPSVPKRLNEIVLKCLEASPEKRYQSTAELTADLEIWLGLRSRPGARLNRWSAMASVIALFAVLVAAVLIRDRFAQNESRAHRPVSVLISDFRNNTGQPVFTGVVEPMFQVAVEGASFISSFNRGQAHKVAAAVQPGATVIDEHLARLVALREGIAIIVGGTVERHDTGFRLSASTMDANGKVLLRDSADFSQANQLPKAVDEVAARVRRVLGDTSRSSPGSGAETFTSGSLESAQKYAQAQQLQWEGRWAEAVELYRAATVLDPKMSRAYAGMAATLANLGKRQEAEHYYQLALANINRESEREKFRTRGGYYLLMRDYQKAAEQFSQLVKQYPVDSAGLANLALSYFYARNMTAALEEGRKAVAIYPQNILQRNNVGLYAMYAGDFDAAIKESQSIIQLNPAFEKAYLCLGISQLQKGSPEEATATFTKLSKLSDWGASEGALALGDLALYQGRFSDAAHLLQAGVAADFSKQNTGAAATKLVALADAQLHLKQKGPALKSAAQAVGLSDDESVLYSAAMIDLQAGEKGTAAALSAKLDARFEPEPRALAKLIDGESQMGSGKLHDALASFEDAQKLADTWLGRNELGRVYLAAKVYPDAENEFDVCLKRRGEVSAVFLDDEPTMRYFPPLYYHLGLAQNGLHSPSAGDSFRTFMSLRKGSEPDSLREQAKIQLQSK